MYESNDPLQKPNEYVVDLWRTATYGGLTATLVRKILLTTAQCATLLRYWRMAHRFCEECIRANPSGYHRECGLWYLRYHREQPYLQFFEKPWEHTDTEKKGHTQ